MQRRNPDRFHNTSPTRKRGPNTSPTRERGTDTSPTRQRGTFLKSCPSLARRAGVVGLVLFLLFLNAPLQAAPDFILEQTDGTSITAPLEKLNEDWSLKLQGKSFKADGWLSFRQANQTLPAQPEGRQILLHNGDRLALGKGGLKLADEKLQFPHSAFPDQTSTIDISRIAVIWLASPLRSGDPETVQRLLLQSKREQDVVILSNGDRLTGLVSVLDDKVLQIESTSGAIKVDLKRIAYVALSTELAERLNTKSIYGHVVLSNGDRLSLKQLTCADGKTITGETLFGAKLKVPLDQIASVTLLNAQASYLSQMKPESYEHKPWLDLRWPLGMNASATGGALLLKDGTYDRGLGMHSPSKVTFSIPEKAKRFQAKVGLDAKTGRMGNARIRVLLDDKEAPLSVGDITFASSLIHLNVAVGGAKTITLIVESGKRGDLGDHVNWVNARFVR